MTGIDLLATDTKSSSKTQKLEKNVEAIDTNGIIVHKFLVEMVLYPDGRLFPKIIPIGMQNRGRAKPKKKAKAATQAVLVEEESY